jgi:hypothetical protein
MLARDGPGGRTVAVRGPELPAGLTRLVAENGSGKSTVMEMLAIEGGYLEDRVVDKPRLRDEWGYLIRRTITRMRIQ